MNNILIISHDPVNVIAGCGAILARQIFYGDIVKVVIVNYQVNLLTTSKGGYEKIFLDRVYKKKCTDAFFKLGIRDVVYDEQLTNFFELSNNFKNIFNPNLIFTDIDCGFGGNVINLRNNIFMPFLKDNAVAVYSIDPLLSDLNGIITLEKNFIPDTYVDVLSWINIKIEALNLLSYELAGNSNLTLNNAVIGRSKLHGCHSGLQAAEALKLVAAAQKLGERAFL